MFKPKRTSLKHYLTIAVLVMMLSQTAHAVLLDEEPAAKPVAKPKPASKTAGDAEYDRLKMELEKNA